MHTNQADTATEIRSQLEYPACPFCGGLESRALLAATDDWNPQSPAKDLRFQVRRCAACRTCFTSPRFREEAKHIPFLGGYPFYERARRSETVIGEQEMRPFLERARILQHTHPHPGSVLDVGMGDGAFLTLMRARGWSVFGMDNESGVVSYARKLGLQNCVCADMERDPLPGGPFDAVTMWGVLQLAYRPQVLLEKVRGVLRTGGIIAVGVSNFSGAGARLFGRFWRGLGLPRHLVHFEPHSLRRLLEASGYEILQMRFQTPEWIVGPSLQAALPLPRVLGGIARRALVAMLRLVERTHLGDTMVLVARPRQ